jgi:hypothetical protein
MANAGEVLFGRIHTKITEEEKSTKRGRCELREKEDSYHGVHGVSRSKTEEW